MAHRGHSKVAPEQTRPAFERARDLGVDFLEADVQRTKDGQLVLMHDRTLKRTTDVATQFPARARAGVDAFRYDELSQLDVGSVFNRKNPKHADPAYRGETILRLAELAEIAEGSGDDGPGLILEAKRARHHPGIEKDIVDELTRLGWLSSEGECRRPVVFQSFDLDSLREFQKLAPKVPRLFLTEGRRPFGRILADAKSVGAFAIGGFKYRMGPLNVWRAHRAGIEVYPWTVNSALLMKAMARMGVDGFFTDAPDAALTRSRERNG